MILHALCHLMYATRSIQAAQSRDNFGLEVKFRLLSCSNVLRNHRIKVYKTFHSHETSNIGDSNNYIAFQNGCKINRAARESHAIRGCMHTKVRLSPSQIVHVTPKDSLFRL